MKRFSHTPTNERCYICISAVLILIILTANVSRYSTKAIMLEKRRNQNTDTCSYIFKFYVVVFLCVQRYLIGDVYIGYALVTSIVSYFTLSDGGKVS